MTHPVVLLKGGPQLVGVAEGDDAKEGGLVCAHLALSGREQLARLLLRQPPVHRALRALRHDLLQLGPAQLKAVTLGR